MDPDTPVVLVEGERRAMPPIGPRLLNALERSPKAALAVAARSQAWSSARPRDLGLVEVLRAPRDLAPVAVRPGVVLGLEVPELAPPDVVAGEAWAWLLTLAVLARGAACVGVPAAPRTGGPHRPSRLRPEGRAWLLQQALKLVPDAALPRETCLGLLAATDSRGRA